MELFRFFRLKNIIYVLITLVFVPPFVLCSKEEENKSEKPGFKVVLPGDEGEREINENLQVKVGQRFVLSYSGKFANCDDCSYEWKMGEDVISTSASLSLVFCDEGEYSINFRVLSKGEEKSSSTLKVMVEPQPLDRPEDVQEAIDIYKKYDFIIGTDEKKTEQALSRIGESILKLEGYVRNVNSCDVDAIYALSLGKVVGILSELNKLITNFFLGNLTRQDIIFIVDDLVKPAKEILEAIVNSGAIPPDFSFRVKRLYIRVIKDYPETPWQVEKVVVNLTGEHDITDFYFLVSLVEFVTGAFDVVIAYNGAIDFILNLPQNVLTRLQDGRTTILRGIVEALVDELEKNPAFLGLSVDAGPRLKSAQSDFYNAFRNLQRMFNSLKEETDEQSDDIIRYWDCGPDKICPGDKREPFADLNANGQRDDNEPFIDLNRNEEWNDAWQKPDEGEGDGRYTIGEMIGTEKIQTTTNPDGIFLVLSGNLGQQVYTVIFERKIFDIIAQNIKGGILDIGKIIGSSNEALRNLLCSQGIPFPEIRLWEFFVSPTSLRDMLPLWDPNKKTLIVQRDTEPFEDTGLDRKYSYEYEGFDPIRNPDPDRDDVNPPLNAQDGVDTDQDGKCTNSEAYCAWKKKNDPNSKCPWEDIPGYTDDDPRSCLNYVSSGIDGQDFGLESNLLFDWIDKNGNKVPDRADKTENWNDNFGIQNGGKGTGGKDVIGNNKFDVRDVEHIWPDGRRDPKNGVGPGGIICANGPYGGDDDYDGDKKGDVIDLIYLLFQDPTFSGVLNFYKGEQGVIKNSEGEVLTENAILHRALWKAVELLGIIDNYPYR